MAQYGQSSLTVGPFGYAAQYGNSDAHAETEEEVTDYEPILNNGDQAQLASFFDNPDEANTNGNLFFNQFFGMDNKPESAATGGNSNFSQAPGTVDHMTTNLTGDFGDNYTSRSGNQQPSQAGQMGNLFGTAPTTEPDSRDMFAAGLLTDLSTHGVNNPAHTLSADSFMQGSWGRLNTFGHAMTHDSPHSPMTSSGRQSSNGLHPAHAQSQGLQYGSQQQFPHLQQSDLAHAQQAHARHPSLSAATPAYLYNQYFQQQLYSPSHGRSQSRPPLPQGFGSDPNFGSAGFYSVPYIAHQQQEKASNLMNLPLVPHVVGAGHLTMQGRDGPTPQRTQSTVNLPNGLINARGQASPIAHLGGLPLSRSASVTEQQATGRSRQRGQTTRKGPERGENEEQPPRKRRKSQIDREDEEEYRPENSMQTSMLRRGSKVAKVEEGSDDDASAATPNTASAKRRKSELTNRSRDASGSPSVDPAGGRKKRGDAKSRQNLTDKEKRQNHILSEQKRRNMIKECFADLETMVPSLANGKAGFSKSEALKEVIAMIENTLAGNESISEGLGIDDDAEHGDGSAGGKYEAEPRGVGIFE